MKKKVLLTSLVLGVLILAVSALYFKVGLLRPRENVVFKSQIKNITISNADMSYFLKTLEEKNFWSENSIFTNSGTSVKPISIKSLTVVLQPNEQRWGGIMSQKAKRRVASFDFENIDDTGVISIWVDTEYYKSEGSINEVFTKVLYESVFTVSEWGTDPNYRLALPTFLNSVEQEKKIGASVNPVVLNVK